MDYKMASGIDRYGLWIKVHAITIKWLYFYPYRKPLSVHKCGDKNWRPKYVRGCIVLCAEKYALTCQN